MYRWILLALIGLTMNNTHASFIQKSIEVLNTIEESNFIHSYVAYIKDGDQYEIVSNGPKEISTKHLFQIGSLTKGYTGVVVSRLVDKGVLSLDTTLGAHIKNLNKEIGEITLKELVTHTSGLPTDGDDLHKRSNPYKNYSKEKLISFINEVSLNKKGFIYSNIGTALVGLLIEEISGRKYSDLLDELFTELQMNSSSLLSKDIIQGYTGWLNKTGPWDLGVAESSGAISSSLEDQIKFSNFLLSTKQTSTFAPLFPIGDFAIGYFWGVSLSGDLITHAGQTLGHSSFLAVDRKKDRAIVVLSNTGVDLNFLLNLIEDEEVKIPSNFFIKKLYKDILK